MEKTEFKVISLNMSLLWWGILEQMAKGPNKTIVDTITVLLTKGIMIDLILKYPCKEPEVNTKQTCGFLKIWKILYKDNISYERIKDANDMANYLRIQTKGKPRAVRLPEHLVNYVQMIAKNENLSPSYVALMFIMSAVILYAERTTKSIGLPIDDINLLDGLELHKFIVEENGGISYNISPKKTLSAEETILNV